MGEQRRWNLLGPIILRFEWWLLETKGLTVEERRLFQEVVWAGYFLKREADENNHGDLEGIGNPLVLGKGMVRGSQQKGVGDCGGRVDGFWVRDLVNQHLRGKEITDAAEFRLRALGGREQSVGFACRRQSSSGLISLGGER